MKNVIAFLFFSLSALAQGDLIDPVADAYLIEDVKEGMVFIHVCYGKNNLKLDCPQSVQVAETDLTRFVQEWRFQELDENSATFAAASTALLVYGFGLVADNFSEKIRKAGQTSRFSLTFASTVIAIGFIKDLLEFWSIKDISSSEVRQYLSSQIHSGVVGGSGEDNRQILEQLTDFLNEYARPAEVSPGEGQRF